MASFRVGTSAVVERALPLPAPGMDMSCEPFRLLGDLDDRFDLRGRPQTRHHIGDDTLPLLACPGECFG